MTRRLRRVALAGFLLSSTLAPRMVAQEVPQSQHRLGIRAVSTEVRDTINPRWSEYPNWSDTGKWLVVRFSMADRDPGTLGVRLTSVRADREVYPLYQVVEVGSGGLWLEQDTTMTAHLTWPWQMASRLVFDVAAFPGPYRLHVGPLCIAVPPVTTVPQPDARCVSVRVLSAAQSDSALIRFGSDTKAMPGPWLAVWVEMEVVGDGEVEAGAIALVSAESSFDQPPDALVVDSAGGPALEFIAAGYRTTLTPATGRKVAVLNRGRGYGGVELTLEGRNTVGLLFHIGHLSPPYGLFFGDSTYAVPIELPQSSWNSQVVGYGATRPAPGSAHPRPTTTARTRAVQAATTVK